MLPLKLTMEAFGPYLAPQVVDFAPFSDRFLIYGETGTGKELIVSRCTMPEAARISPLWR